MGFGIGRSVSVFSASGRFGGSEVRGTWQRGVCQRDVRGAFSGFGHRALDCRSWLPQLTSGPQPRKKKTAV